jgi:hypothetical protein
MRTFKLLVATATALFFAPGALPAQSLAEAAAKEKARRKALEESSKKPARSYTEDDLARAGGGKGSTSFTSGPDAAPAPAGEGSAAPATEGASSGKAEKSEDEKRAEAQAAWRKSLDEARTSATNYRDQVTKLQNDLNDTSNLYGSRRTTLMNFLDDTKAKLSAADAKVADLEEQGRKSGYR